MAQGFVGLNSPPLVFTSPRIICQRETKFLERFVTSIVLFFSFLFFDNVMAVLLRKFAHIRPQCTQSPSVEICQSDNGDRSLVIEPPDNSKKLRSQLPLPGKFITDTQKDVDIKNDASTQNCSPPPSVDEYLADPVDIDRIYSANPDEKQSGDAVESSLSDLTQSKNITLKFDDKDGPGDKAEEPLLLSHESNKEVHQEKPAHVEEPGKVEEEENDIEWASQECTKLESHLSADVLEKQHSHDSLAQVTIGSCCLYQ